ncbi:hypothetical protein SCOR_02565 [Sulfidibacter corallicola]|uniref:Uncharacterized protein n=1 Tax=Sulfidibacter corallicola TaxID=2818388 RepID=A0A8A4TIC9_SULCO|nr:hypothetical protein [Sulfidibacter corallicola]QTD48591.1 hypothetical protein J3U87_23670 [Sulfidibacter corallicola]
MSKENKNIDNIHAKPKRRTFTTEYKLRILEEVDSADQKGQIGGNGENSFPLQVRSLVPRIKPPNSNVKTNASCAKIDGSKKSFTKPISSLTSKKNSN